MIEALPYDRARTTLGAFAMCARCAAEHADPDDRRFHAEAIACPACGPSLTLLDAGGAVVERRAPALEAAARAVRGGAILALKGLGGYQLVVDATNEDAVARLRARKRREEKPFAVLVGSLAEARRLCVVSAAEAALLVSAAAPIVLLRRRAGGGLAAAVAPGLPRLGVMLPATPLHTLLAETAGAPLVCTSGNVSEEPICIDEAEALGRLAGIADVWLAHDRAIRRPVDDSVVQVGPRGPEMLRRARGYVPLPLSVPLARRRVLAFGGQQKSTVTLVADGRAIVGEHIGDLASPAAVGRLERAARDLCALGGATPEAIACDAHPDFASSRIAARWAEARAIPLVRVQHHHAHAAACAAEHGLAGPIAALCWDGAGLGDDGTLWGGEALLVDGPRSERAAHLRTFPLPGAARAMRDPVRALVGLAVEAFGADAAAWLAREGLAGHEVARAVEIARRPSLAPRTSSMGRLFDGVAALLGRPPPARVRRSGGDAARGRGRGGGGGRGDGRARPLPDAARLGRPRLRPASAGARRRPRGGGVRPVLRGPLPRHAGSRGGGAGPSRRPPPGAARGGLLPEPPAVVARARPARDRRLRGVRAGALSCERRRPVARAGGRGGVGVTMCLGIPGEIVSIEEAGALRTGKVRFGGAAKTVCLAYVPEAAIGDFVVVHAGFAISRMDRAAAARVFSYLEEIGERPES